MANGRCRVHGGKNLAGVSHPQFKHGRYSKVIPERLRAQYEEAQDDPDLLSTREDVAFLQARIADLSQRLNSGESGQTWQNLRREWSCYRRAAAEASRLSGSERSEAEVRSRTHLEAVNRLISAGATEAQNWEELGKALNQKTRLAKAEWNRLVDMKQLLTAEQAYTLVHRLLAAVLTHVSDKVTRRAIAREFQQITGPRAPVVINLPAEGNDVGPVKAPAPPPGGWNEEPPDPLVK
jgi:Spy/CpxP family protein refolding chaperone